MLLKINYRPPWYGRPAPASAGARWPRHKGNTGADPLPLPAKMKTKATMSLKTKDRLPWRGRPAPRHFRTGMAMPQREHRSAPAGESEDESHHVIENTSEVSRNERNKASLGIEGFGGLTDRVLDGVRDRAMLRGRHSTLCIVFSDGVVSVERFLVTAPGPVVRSLKSSNSNPSILQSENPEHIPAGAGNIQHKGRGRTTVSMGRFRVAKDASRFWPFLTRLFARAIIA